MLNMNNLILGLTITIAVLCLIAKIRSMNEHNKRSKRAKMRIRDNGKFAHKVKVSEFGKPIGEFYL